MKPKFNMPGYWKIILGIFFVVLIGLVAKRLKTAPPPILTACLRLSKNILPADSTRELTLQLGIRLAKSKDYMGARKVFEDFLAVEPTNASVLNNLAFVAGEQGEFDKAIEYLRTALLVNDSCAECYNNLGSLLYRKGQLDEAKQSFEHAAHLDPKYIDAQLNLAVLLEEQSDWVGAMEWYKQAETGVTEPEMKRWVAQRAQWMAELTQNKQRQVAGDK